MHQERDFLHDISSPLTSIHLNIENAIFILEDAEPGSVAECVKVLQACLPQAEKLMAMIRERREELKKADAK